MFNKHLWSKCGFPPQWTTSTEFTQGIGPAADEPTAASSAIAGLSAPQIGAPSAEAGVAPPTLPTTTAAASSATPLVPSAEAGVSTLPTAAASSARPLVPSAEAGVSRLPTAAPAAPAVAQPRAFPWNQAGYNHPKDLVDVPLPVPGSRWGASMTPNLSALALAARMANLTWRKSLSYAMNKAMRHDVRLPRNSAGFCYLDDLAVLLPVGNNGLPRRPTLLEMMYTVHLEKVGRFEGTSVFGCWPPYEIRRPSKLYSGSQCRRHRRCRDTCPLHRRHRWRQPSHSLHE